MFEATTASPKRPNFFWYCFRTCSWKCSRVIPKSRRNGDTPKNAPRNALPCIRSWRSVLSVAFLAIAKPGRM